MTQAHWWQGKRGEWYVVIQVILFLVVLLAPRTLPGLPAWSSPLNWIGFIGGAILVFTGGLLSLAGVLRLGSSLTAVPYPKEDATMVDSGPYRLVRHPIYSGIILAAFGWALFVNGWLTLVYALILFIFFDIKSRREERWLSQKYQNYPVYQKRVHKLIPFVY